MLSTVLGSWDLFWIWFIVVMINGGATYWTSAKDAIDTLEKQIATLAEEIRRRG